MTEPIKLMTAAERIATVLIAACLLSFFTLLVALC